MLVLAVLWLAFKPRPEVVVDRAMRSETIDRLVAKLNDHYVFPEKARQMEAVLRQRRQAGMYDGTRTGYRLVQQLTADLHGVVLLVSYFVDGRTRLNDRWERETGKTVQHWTYDELDGKRYGGRKPVMILVGPGTASVGEDFAYTMQALKRATVVGASTWGGAQPFNTHRIGGHFYVQIPDPRSISPIAGTTGKKPASRPISPRRRKGHWPWP
ncbi:S41 family peptidase [Massilia sp. BSC265]|uniref:S41 family peptidase n=1 Tax=Massilia sp. BSC265 TaxID=1549812 RepID=UPI0006924EA5|nr:S41 family peptidase [Massilia sp. BSC265]